MAAAGALAVFDCVGCLAGRVCSFWADAVGGSEQILTALDQAVVAAGHTSIVLAMDGSEADGELVTYPAPAPDQPITEEVCTVQRSRVARAMRQILQTRPVDVIHMHGL